MWAALLLLGGAAAYESVAVFELAAETDYTFTTAIDVKVSVVGQDAATVTPSDSASVFTLDVTGLLPDTEYEVWVQGYNTAGYGDWSEPMTNRTARSE